MPSFSQQAISFFAALALTSSITTTTIVCTNDFKFATRRESRKFSKKKNEAQRECTWRNFSGSSKYRNCQNIETEIKIGCGDEDADDTTRMCKVTEHPWNNEQKEDDTTACVVHGLFDPKTHITTDSATGFCHLKFLSLLDSCDVDANSSPSRLFGMKAEIHKSRNTEYHNDDNSGMLLRFSRTRGAKYYNDDNPRETVPLHAIIPARRNLEEEECKFGYTCKKPQGTFGGWSCDKRSYKNNREGCYDGTKGFKDTTCWNSFSSGDAHETCFSLGGPFTGIRCWSKYHYVEQFMGGNWRPCVPNPISVHGETELQDWYVALPKSDGTCGGPCGDQGFDEDNHDPKHCIWPRTDDKLARDQTYMWCSNWNTTGYHKYEKGVDYNMDFWC